MRRSREAQAARNRKTGEIVKKFKRMRDGRQQPETLIARATEGLYLPHLRNARGKVEHWTLPWVCRDEEQAREGFQGVPRGQKEERRVHPSTAAQNYRARVAAG